MFAISRTGFPVSKPASVAEQRLFCLEGVTHNNLGPIAAGGGGGGGRGGGGGGGGRDFTSNSSSSSFTETNHTLFCVSRVNMPHFTIFPLFLMNFEGM